MKHLLNTLFVTTPGAYVCRDGEAVTVRIDNELRLRVPVHTLGGIVFFGGAVATSPLLELCGERGVSVSFLSATGRFQGRLEGPASGNVLLRRRQFRVADDEGLSADIARSIVVAKVANSRTVLLRYLRDHADSAGVVVVTSAARHLSELMNTLERCCSGDVVRGLEGDAARTYFGVFDHLVVAQKDSFPFRGRSRRPPMDNINALLSFLYTLLAHDCRAALESVGLDPMVGYLHTDRPGRPSLALDLMEEFRPFVADRLALSLINRCQVQASGFLRTESGGVTMDDAVRKEVIVAWQNRKQEEIEHPFLEEKVKIGLLPFCQALLLARHLRRELDGYPPFLWR